MKDSDRRSYVIEHNPWWRSSQWAQRDPDLSEARGNALSAYEPRPLADLTQGSLHLLLGPRRAGKSVAMKREIVMLLERGVDPRAITFCPCEGLSAQDLRRIVKIAAELSPLKDADRYWFFDEITYVQDWGVTLKQLRDQTLLRQGTVVATGSSAAKLREALGDLGGREGPGGGVRLLLPMGFRDFLRETNEELASALPQETLDLEDLQSETAAAYLQPLQVFADEVAGAWERYLMVGGFPRAVADIKNNMDVQDATVRGLWHIFVGDVLHVGSMSERDVKALVARIVNGMGSPLNLTNITSDLEIGSRNTVQNRIDRLCNSFYMWRASVTHDGLKPVAGGQDKLYAVDPLVARLPSFGSRIIEPPDIAQLNEQQVGVSLLGAIGHGDLLALLDESALMVRRNPDSGAEIDFAGPLLPTAVESKYVSDGWKSEKRALEDTYGAGIMATRDAFDLRDKIWAVPSGLLAWSVGR
jgi:predicted AAA+ superfamily ATPase